jgi:hypothetical protein
MPVNRAKMKRLKSEYGSEKGERIYYALENKHNRKKRKKRKKKTRGLKLGR